MRPDTRTCQRCGNSFPVEGWPRYECNGRLKVVCTTCDAELNELRAQDADAKARGYLDRTHTPEFKRAWRERQGQRNGRTLAQYKPQAQREHEAAMARVEMCADKLRRRFQREQSKCLYATWWDGYKHSPEYLEEKRIAFSQRYQRDPESERLRIVKYKHSNPDKVAKWGDKRKQRAALYSDGSLTREEVGRLFGEAKRCPYCERELNGSNKSLDHMIPLSRGGAHGLRNVLISCRECNLRKKAIPFGEWIKTLSASCERRAARIYRQRYGTDPCQATLTLAWSQTA